MRKTWLFLTALCIAPILSSPVSAAEELSPKQLLAEMTKAKAQLNYQLTFVQANPNNIESLRYRHLNQDGKIYAQLATLDGAKQEIIQRVDLISYFQANYQPFTIHAKHIVDSLPNIMYGNFDRLAQYYDFVNIGRNRVADRIVQTIRILPKDNFRHQYIVFIDEENHLLLRSDMLDRDGNLLEQFRVVNLYLGDDLGELQQYLVSVPFPPLLTEKKEGKQRITSWKTSWLPQGFSLINEKIETEENSNNIIESRLYSDGLFSFTLYVSNKILPDVQENVWKQGSNTIYSENIGEKEVTLIGQIPVSTAKRIIQDIKFN
ncbi:MAG TPA: sigma-E factor regulatory protein RseB [Pasteurellaceae bacterium]|nr:sigma-E factor regulatory protein RseB [Pasteurellaceae bacterium]